MILPLEIWAGGEGQTLGELGAPLRLDELAPGPGAWQVELGFGRASWLVAGAERGEDRFLGVEVARQYYRIGRRKVRGRGLANVVLVRGEAEYVMAAVLPRRFATAVHVYFPDPWPKSRHRKRRFLDESSVDLVLGLLVPGGELVFASDHPEYGETVREILAAHPAVDVRVLDSVWPGGPRTNYEKKYLEEGRPILRLVATLRDPERLLHPAGEAEIVSATCSE